MIDDAIYARGVPMSPTRFLPVLLALSMAIVASSCGWDYNSNYCCVQAEVCARPGGSPGPVPCSDPDRPICDEEHRLCVPDPISSDCEQSSDCTSADRPVCVDGRCRECDGEGGCDATAPVCDVDGAYTCGPCLDDGSCSAYATTPRCETTSGACVECLSSAEDCLDLARPVCGSDYQCRVCQGDGECPSQVCDVGTGACVAETDVIYLAPSGSGSQCTLAAPCGTFAAGLAQVTASRKVVKMASGSYSERVSIADKTVIIHGTGADLSASTAGQVVDITGAADVTITGLRINTGLGPTGDGLRCTDNGPSPTVVLAQVTLDTNGGKGVNATNCDLTIAQSTLQGNTGGGLVVSGGSATVQRSTITGNSGGGLSLSNGTFSIINTFIVGNGNPTGAFGGVSILSPGSGTRLFDFNTVYNNDALDGNAAGVVCSLLTNPVNLSDSIIYGNQSTAQVAGTMCTASYSDIGPAVFAGTGNFAADPQFVDAPNGDYHIEASSPCVGAADPAATVAIDFDGDARTDADCGADEVP